MSKLIIYCADGTWNGPGQDENDDREPDPTNVYKLFVGLAGQPATETRDADEQEKELRQNGRSVQVAKYVHGVGDSRNPIKKLMGGAFGAGTISRIVRGYTFISRNYESGDHIVVAGFSRGAYTARALAGLIGSPVRRFASTPCDTINPASARAVYAPRLNPATTMWSPDS